MFSNQCIYIREGRSDLGVTDRDRSDLDLGEGHDQENLKVFYQL